MQFRINWLAVLAATFAGMFIGFIFYGLLFQDAWSAAVGLTTEDDTNFLKWGTPVELDPVTPMIINAVLMAGYAIFLSWLTSKTGDTTAAAGAGLGAVVGLVFATGQAVGNLFAMNDTMLSLIDGSYLVVLFAVIGAIVGGWRPKVTT